MPVCGVCAAGAGEARHGAQRGAAHDALTGRHHQLARPVALQLLQHRLPDLRSIECPTSDMGSNHRWHPLFLDGMLGSCLALCVLKATEHPQYCMRGCFYQ